MLWCLVQARLFIQRSPGICLCGSGMRVLYSFAFLVLMFSAPSQVHAADTGKSGYDFGAGKFGGCPLVASRALPCTSCPCAPDTGFPCLGNGDLASVLLVPFVAPGASPSLRTWRLRTMYIVKFDWVILFELKGWAAATLPRAAPLAAIWLGLPARSRTCPPRFQTPMPLALFVACWAAPLQPARVLSLDLQLGAAGDLVSGKGKCTSERKAGSLDLPLDLGSLSGHISYAGSRMSRRCVCGLLRASSRAAAAGSRVLLAHLCSHCLQFGSRVGLARHISGRLLLASWCQLCVSLRVRAVWDPGGSFFPSTMMVPRGPWVLRRGSMPHQGRLAAPLAGHCRRQLHIFLWSRFWGSKGQATSSPLPQNLPDCSSGI